MPNISKYISVYIIVIATLVAVFINGCSATNQTGQSGIMTGNRIGNLAQDFNLHTTDGREIKLSDYRGQNVILNFWATWCGPCRYEMPFFQAVQEKWDKSGVIVLAIATMDDPDSVRSYAKVYNLKFTIPVDVMGNVAKKYGISGMPTTFFIDQEGIITSVRIGPFITQEEIEDMMKSFDIADNSTP
ncbi:MAG: TlpA disulfide reductase family protein [Dehalococcoidia bacterium]|nr:TlpA disulfide reductase family protein [Dehalococcoidia bacterium]MDD5493494.1 TlpA disulfide reductase family protein [Dehalococcoidia bacterium]